MEKKNYKQPLFYILLIIGFASLSLMRIVQTDSVFAVTNLIWPVLFLYLTKCFCKRRQLILIGFVFVIGYASRFWGIMGIPVIDILLLPFAAGLIYCLFLIYHKLTVYLAVRWNEGNESILFTLFFTFLWMMGYFLALILKIPSLMRIDMYFFSCKYLIQCTELITSYGFSFLILWICSLVAYMLYRKSYAAFGMILCILSLMMLFGYVRLHDKEEIGERVRIAYSTGPYVGNFLNYKSLSLKEAMDSLEKSVRLARKKGADMIVFNEQAFEIQTEWEEEFCQFASQKARECNMNILVGLDISDEQNEKEEMRQNKMVFIRENGESGEEYYKYKTIPVMEDSYQKGDGKIPMVTVNLEGKDVNISFAICYDSNFPTYIRTMDNRTDLLVLPSWDWKGISELHRLIASMLAVENRVCILKPTYDGISVAVDSDGNEFMNRSTDETGYENVQIVELPLEGER